MNYTVVIAHEKETICLAYMICIDYFHSTLCIVFMGFWGRDLAAVAAAGAGEAGAALGGGPGRRRGGY